MAKKTEYLVSRVNRDFEKINEFRVPKGINLKLLLERLICRDLNNDTIIASCLHKNAKRAYDPFQIFDERDEHRREQAKAALNSDPNTDDPIGVYNRARDSRIPIGKTLLIAGLNHDYFIKEVEI